MTNWKSSPNNVIISTNFLSTLAAHWTQIDPIKKKKRSAFDADLVATPKSEQLPSEHWTFSAFVCAVNMCASQRAHFFYTLVQSLELICVLCLNNAFYLFVRLLFVTQWLPYKTQSQTNSSVTKRLYTCKHKFVHSQHILIWRQN